MTFARWLRLALKELRETLRDRRTLATLVGMPLILYPLLNVALQQLLKSGSRGAGEIVYRIGARTEQEAAALTNLLKLADADRPEDAPAPSSILALPNATAPKPPRIEIVFAKDADLKAALGDGTVQALAALDPMSGPNPQDPRGMFARVVVETLEGSGSGRAAAEALTRRLESAGRKLLGARLRQLQVPQGPRTLAVERRSLPDPRPGGGLPLAALMPLALALMTATGAVYPAIDLTAGERERGTLEALMCTPAPRFAVLSAKYVAVFAVAMLTAAINLGAAAGTIAASSLGPLLFAPGALTWKTAVLVAGAMALFAAFFAAALLAVSCFARSFKEAQAYLIPLMLIALTPGLASLLPGVELDLATAVVPLLNVVLLTRDCFQGQADLGLAAVVAASNLLYAAAALTVAARAFGAEGILYGGAESWSGALRRPEPGGAPGPHAAGLALVAAAPLFLLGMGAADRLAGSAAGPRLGAGAVVNLLLFAGVPLALRWRQRWRGAALGFRTPALLALVAAVLLGATAWPLALQLEQWFAKAFGGALDLAGNPELKARAEQALADIAALPLALRLLCIAAIPACAEELFFRGLLLGGLRSKGPWLAIGGSALAFAAFHVVGPTGLMLPRFAPTLLLGLLMGVLRWRSGSLLPGMALHALHNGLAAWTLGDPTLLTKVRGVAIVADKLQLSWGLLATSAASVAVGLALAWRSRRREESP